VARNDNNNNNNNNQQQQHHHHHERTTENGNHTEETQHGPSPAPPNIGATAKQGSTFNKRIRWSREEMKEVVWCSLCVKETTSTENYKAAYELWRKRNPNLRTNMDAKLLLNKNYILRNKKLQTLKLMR
jgi:hypothetical protein